ncbi:MAG: hypothetical protein E7378_03540 [Clostridiales bacterium]|nr:hypothetical protein [Clostridiales bacterium]
MTNLELIDIIVEEIKNNNLSILSDDVIVDFLGKRGNLAEVNKRLPFNRQIINTNFLYAGEICKVDWLKSDPKNPSGYYIGFLKFGKKVIVDILAVPARNNVTMVTTDTPIIVARAGNSKHLKINDIFVTKLEKIDKNFKKPVAYATREVLSVYEMFLNKQKLEKSIDSDYPYDDNEPYPDEEKDY